jgi:uracil-DNA glycosylase
MQSLLTKMTLDTGWKSLLSRFTESPEGLALDAYLKEREAAGAQIFPAKHQYFRALELTPLHEVRVVILGQDPYHGPGQAHGLSFSVKPGVAIPPSLRNIYAELQRDFGRAPPTHGFLESWANQGVLMLNAVLSVEEGTPGAHKGRGWEMLTDDIISAVNALAHPVAFMFWGLPAQKKAALVTAPHHARFLSSHPSPRSAYRGFLGCGHFSKANAFLKSHARQPVDWAISDAAG